MEDRENLLQPVNHIRLSDQAYESLRDCILRKELSPGLRLDLDTLQRQLGISRTPLKEAVNRLAAEGLITHVPRRGTYVTDLTPQNVAERFDARKILEIGAVDEIMDHLTDDHLAELRQRYESIRSHIAAGSVGDYFEFLVKDREFHRALIAITGNRMVADIYEGLNLNVQMAIVFYPHENKRMDLVDDEHRHILASLEQHDRQGLKAAITQHIQQSKRAVLSTMEMNRTGDTVASPHYSPYLREGSPS
jgi:DNA-binding GntR family transcriptional regulator